MCLVRFLYPILNIKEFKLCMDVCACDNSSNKKTIKLMADYHPTTNHKLKGAKPKTATVAP